MKIRFSFLLFILFCFSSYSQKVYTFLAEMSSPTGVPSFTRQGNYLVYNGTDPTESSFYGQYQILDFSQSFPASEVARTLNVYTIATYTESLKDDVVTSFPIKYLGINDITEIDSQLANTYPDDYGTTHSPNLGVPLSFENYDYINVPKAWDYGYGNSNVKIGISDSGVNIYDPDFSGKTTMLAGYIPYSPYYTMSNESWHGTATAAIAAAQGNNSGGTVGICSNCSIVATNYGYGNPGTPQNPTPGMNNLLLLANAGAQVINMSWGWLSPDSPRDYINNYYQWIFDELHAKNVVLVASSHNTTSFQTAYAANNYMLYSYPASFNHVISICSVNHKNEFGEVVVFEPGWGDVTLYAKDMVSKSIVMNYQGNGPYAFSNSSHTTNDLVDICAPGWETPMYPWYVLGHTNSTGQPLYYGSGTSSSAPHVSGTVGLMLSLNDCLINDEVEDILQLTSKNLERIPGNEPFIGRSGSGKLETGDSVEFVKEMMLSTGNAIIDDQDFHRFTFDLHHINNKLTVSNQIFRDSCVAKFTAKKVIEILTYTDLKPGSVGEVDFKIDSDLSITCSDKPGSGLEDNGRRETKDVQPFITRDANLYPNPNNGSFSIMFNTPNTKDISVTIFDVLGKMVYNNIHKGKIFDINVNNIPSGVYIVKLTTQNLNKTLKFIKQ